MGPSRDEGDIEMEGTGEVEHIKPNPDNPFESIEVETTPLGALGDGEGEHGTPPNSDAPNCDAGAEITRDSERPTPAPRPPNPAITAYDWLAPLDPPPVGPLDHVNHWTHPDYPRRGEYAHTLRKLEDVKKEANAMVDGLRKHVEAGAQPRKDLISQMRALKDKVIVQNEAAKRKAEVEKRAAEERAKNIEEQVKTIEGLLRQLAEAKAEKGVGGEQAKKVGEDTQDGDN
ncbi:hypothetical protein E8E11_002674 [Didymella keratinophila]|nr:hypothetical protein E8E11_002674 [Didymella keratinophila]